MYLSDHSYSNSFSSRFNGNRTAYSSFLPVQEDFSKIRQQRVEIGAKGAPECWNKSPENIIEYVYFFSIFNDNLD